MSALSLRGTTERLLAAAGSDEPCHGYLLSRPRAQSGEAAAPHVPLYPAVQRLTRGGQVAGSGVTCYGRPRRICKLGVRPHRRQACIANGDWKPWPVVVDEVLDGPA